MSDPGEVAGETGGMRDDLERMLAFPAKLIPTSVIVPAWRRLTDGESTWPVRCAVIAATGLQVAIPNRYEIPPTWLLPTLGALLGVGLSVAHPRRITRHSPQLRTISILLIAVISLANAGSAARLITALLQGKANDISATTLLLTGGAIWLTNVSVFAMWYWNLDRGGPAARAQAIKQFPDFLFPQMTAPELSPSDWQPEFFDYLYLSFTNAAAFSPTDTLPLARWAKMAMMLQSIVSLGTVVLVVARAVNILK
ncbi:MAG: hypothetical protein ABIZ69_06600 [Ilumatobacteraceae bacterium]